MFEMEYKYLVSKQEFIQAREKAALEFGLPKAQIQLNYYYDDAELSLTRRGVTVRVRQTGNSLTLQIKKHADGLRPFSISKETGRPVLALPRTIVDPEFGPLTLYGSMTTYRMRFAPCPGVSLDFDENSYLGVCDYELELEFDEDQLEKAAQIPHQFHMKPSGTHHKSGRYFEKIRQIGIG